MSRFVIERIGKEEWERFSSNAHLISFSEEHFAKNDRIDYALMVLDRGNVPAGYMTIKEMDAGSAYVQHGGAFPNHEGTVHVVPQYIACIEHLKSRYESLWTRIENVNHAMLKLAMKAGFNIVGTYFHEPKLLLELRLENVLS